MRSDCETILEHLPGKGNEIVINSKVKTLYGRSIKALISDMLSAAGLSSVKVTVNDSGALPFVISARLEAAIRASVNPGFRYRVEDKEAVNEASERDRFRFSRLYLPGNTPSMMLNAALHSPDGIILDLEDSVAPSRKDEARILVRNALMSLDFRGAERMVRINQGERGLDDLEELIPCGVNLVLLPKCQSPAEILTVKTKIEAVQQTSGLKQKVWLMPIIETALGVENAYAIAVASPDVVAVAVGLEDLTADLGVQRTNAGNESFYARSRIVNAARAAGIQAIDSVFSDVADMEGLAATVKESKSLGFEGMGCIHPRQIPVIKQGFAPAPSEIAKAQKIVLAFEEAEKAGLGVVALGSKMIDPPVVSRALRTIRLAIGMGLISPTWRDEIN